MPADSSADSSRAQADALREALSPSSGSDPNVPFVPGDTLGRYVITGRLGEGGMGVVYRAFDPILERRVAIKLVSLNLRNRGLVHSEGARRRLRAEARALASLSHPNIVPIFDVGTVPDGRAYVAMELIEGGTLRDVMPPRGGSWRRGVSLLLEAGRGLAAAHRVGIVHRDFKPENVLVTPEHRIVVADFGIAGLAGEIESQMDVAPRIDDRSTTTAIMHSKTGTAMIGTPAYMPPEQYLGAVPHPTADLYSFCVVLFEWLHGRRPYQRHLSGLDEEGVLAARARGHDSGGAEPTVGPAWLREIVARGLSVRPVDRFSSMDELVHELELGCSRSQQTIGRKGIVASAMLLSVAIALGLAVDVDQASPQVQCESAVTARADEFRKRFDAGLPGTIAEASRKAGLRESMFEKAKRVFDAQRELCRMDRRTDAARGIAMPEYRACVLRRENALRLVFEGVERMQSDDELHLAYFALDKLEEPSRCFDPNFPEYQRPEPSDPRLRASVEALRSELRRGESLISLGQYPQARTLLESLEHRARELGYLPVLGEVLNFGGALFERLENPQKASRYLDEAFLVGVRTRHDRLAYDALLQHMFILGVRLRRPEQASELVDRATAQYYRLGQELPHLFLLLRSAGMAASISQHRAEKLSATRRAARLAADIWGIGSPRHVISEHNYGVILLESGRAQDAERIFRWLAELEQRAQRDYDPDFSRLLNNWGNSLRAQGLHAQALPLHRRALELLRTVFDEKAPRVAGTYQCLGEVHQSLGNLDESLRYFELAVESAAQGRAELDPQLLDMTTYMFMTMIIAGQSQQMIDQYGSWIERVIAAQHHDSWVAFTYTVYLARAYANAGQPESALDRAMTALRQRQVNSPDELPDRERFEWNFSMGEVFAAVGDFERALQCAEADYTAAVGFAGPRNLQNWPQREILARILVKTGDVTRARELLQINLEVAREQGGAALPVELRAADRLEALSTP